MSPHVINKLRAPAIAETISVDDREEDGIDDDNDDGL
jgi:hypothetical protein